MHCPDNTGCLILLATPKFPYGPKSRKKKQSPELATPKKWQSPGLATPKFTRIGDCAIFGGGKSWTILGHFLGVASSRLCFFFFGFCHMGKFGGGKKDQTPCMYK